MSPSENAGMSGNEQPMAFIRLRKSTDLAAHNKKEISVLHLIRNNNMSSHGLIALLLSVCTTSISPPVIHSSTDRSKAVVLMWSLLLVLVSEFR